MRSTFRHGWSTFVRARGGSATIEFVVMFPLLLAVLAFAFEFGRFFIAHQDVVDNVRDAVRYLSRGDLSQTQLDNAEAIVKTGVPSGGTEPDWMTGATITINPDYADFSSSEFRDSGQVIRVEVTVDFPLEIFSLLGSSQTAIPFTVVDDIRHIGE